MFFKYLETIILKYMKSLFQNLNAEIQRSNIKLNPNIEVQNSKIGIQYCDCDVRCKMKIGFQYQYQ